jgi:hypothetical protein
MDARVAAAEQELERSREELREQQSDARAQQVAARRAELEASRLMAEAEVRESESLIERAQAVGVLEGDVKAARTALANHETAEGKLAAALAAARARHNAATEELKDIRGIALFRDHEEHVRAVAKARQDRAARDDLHARADRARTDAERIRAELAAQRLPSAEQLSSLKKLERDAGLAEAALAVGLAVSLSPLKPLEIEVTRDGGAREKHRVEGMAAFEARQSVRLTLVGVGELVVSGGAEDVRFRAAALRNQLDEGLRPVLEASGAADLSAVEAGMHESAARKRLLDELEREGRDLEIRGHELRDVDVTFTRCQERAGDSERELASYDRARLERLSAAPEMARARDRRCASR